MNSLAMAVAESITSDAGRLGMAWLFRTPKIRWQPRTTLQDFFILNKNYSYRPQIFQADIIHVGDDWAV